jgi:hypothetical protein
MKGTDTPIISALKDNGGMAMRPKTPCLSKGGCYMNIIDQVNLCTLLMKRLDEAVKVRAAIVKSGEP